MTCDENTFFDTPELAGFRGLLFEGICLAMQIASKADPAPIAEDPKLSRQNTKSKLVDRYSTLKVRHSLLLQQREVINLYYAGQGRGTTRGAR